MEHHSGNKAVVKSLIWTPFHHSICTIAAESLHCTARCTIHYSALHQMLFSPYTTLTCVGTLDKSALRGLVGNRGELAPLNQVRGLRTKSRLHGTNLCKAVCTSNTLTCANCTGELVEAQSCNSMRRRKAMQGLFRCPELPQALSPKPTGTPQLAPLSLSLTCPYFHLHTFLTQISHIHKCNI